MNVQPSFDQPLRAKRLFGDRLGRACRVAAGLATVASLNILSASAQTPSANTTAPNAPTTTGAPAAGNGAGNSAGNSSGDAHRGLTKAATCLGCHSIPGYKADFPVVYSVPMIGGQNAGYIEAALKEYRKGDRRFPSMMATARSLSDQDIADLAAYFSSQH